MNRRNLLGMGAAAMGSSLLSPLWAAKKLPTVDDFHFAVIADTHIIDEFYKPGSENGAEDNESILQTTPRLTFARDTINTSHPKVEQVFLVGDCFHNYPSREYDFYFQHKTRIDNARELLDGFKVPVQIGWGNHDYDAHIPREMSHRLFEQKLHTQPYYSVDYKGFRFIHLNNFLGDTWAENGDPKLRATGSLGEKQLNWAEAQLAARKPTIVFIHYPLWIVQPTEVRDYGIHPLLRKYQDNIQLVISGHWHKWIDFAHTYGPRHIVMGSTRYDQNSFMLFEADSHRGTIRWMDEKRPMWSTHFATPWKPA